ncbi:hypothetical protein LTR17_001014 [Elasticomyces elasticus]|nr:hypothetical protein LTR17_001014 [Elasticomyces elasticus]
MYASAGYAERCPYDDDLTYEVYSKDQGMRQIMDYPRLAAIHQHRQDQAAIPGAGQAPRSPLSRNQTPLRRGSQIPVERPNPWWLLRIRLQLRHGEEAGTACQHDSSNHLMNIFDALCMIYFLEYNFYRLVIYHIPVRSLAGLAEIGAGLINSSRNNSSDEDYAEFLAYARRSVMDNNVAAYRIAMEATAASYDSMKRNLLEARASRAANELEFMRVREQYHALMVNAKKGNEAFAFESVLGGRDL